MIYFPATGVRDSMVLDTI